MQNLEQAPGWSEWHTGGAVLRLHIPPFSSLTSSPVSPFSIIPSSFSLLLLSPYFLLSFTSPLLHSCYFPPHLFILVPFLLSHFFLYSSCSPVSSPTFLLPPLLHLFYPSLVRLSRAPSASLLFSQWRLWCLTVAPQETRCDAPHLLLPLHLFSPYLLLPHSLSLVPTAPAVSPCDSTGFSP